MKKQIDVATAIADETRLQILHRLMEGPVSVSEMVAQLEKSQSLVSNHLAILRDKGLVTTEKAGRKVHYQLANASVATLIEALGALGRNGTDARPSPEIAKARTCYDHLAGSLGVDIFDWLISQKALAFDGDDLGLGPNGHDVFTALGVDIERASRARRRFAIACLDWTEKKSHLGGSLGAELCNAFIAKGWVTRKTGTRAVALTPAGKRGLGRKMKG